MGAGHDGAAKELRRRLEAAGHRVEVVDFLDAVAFHIGPLLRWFYQVQLRMAPWSYELSYKMAPLLRAPAVMLDTWLTRRKLKRIIKEFRPDAVVSVYPLASLVLGRMRRKKHLRVPVLTYLTDFAVHSLWVHRGIDRHLAVSEISADALRRSYEINVMGTVNLLEAVRACRSVKGVVNVTTDKCYQNNEWLWGYRESEALGGYDPYSSSKACSDSGRIPRS